MNEIFICEKIKVNYNSDTIKPISFEWQNKEYKIKEICKIYQDFSLPDGITKNKKWSWRVRRHRNYYIIKTEEDKKFKIYLDRARGKKEWILLSKYE